MNTTSVVRLVYLVSARPRVRFPPGADFILYG
jgi:hypothetical protein